MSKVILFNPSDPIVAGRVTDYLSSVNTPDYVSNPNALINPDVSGLPVDMRYWKVDTGIVVEMSTGEKVAVDDSNKAKTVREKKYRVMEYSPSGNLNHDHWYDTDLGNGSYSGLAETNEYTYTSGNDALLMRVTTTYFYDGTVSSVSVYDYVSSSNMIIEKKRG
jgi:hypothetical protein